MMMSASSEQSPLTSGNPLGQRRYGEENMGSASLEEGDANGGADGGPSTGGGGLAAITSSDRSSLSGGGPPHGHRRRRTNSIMDSVMESMDDLKDTIAETFEHLHIAETLEEVKEVVEERMEEIREEISDVLHEPIEPVKPREEGDHNQKLSAIALAILVFYKVSGGPFGCEPTIRAAGPLVGLLGFIIFPFVWCIPEALVTAELGSAFPEPSGAIAWVEEAFGSQAGLLCGYFHWVSGATDNAIYPSLFLEYVSSYLSGVSDVDLTGNATRFLFCAVMSVILALVNYTGLEIVGNLSIVVCIISMSPFVILFILGMQKIQIDRLMILPAVGIENDDDSLSGDSWFPDPVWLGVLWRPFLNNLFWNMNSFDVGASFAGEVRDPERVFPRAMFLSIILVSASYILPLVAALGAVDSEQKDWNAGYLAALASKVGGEWLGMWTVFAAAISNIALFEAELSGDAYQLMGMADRGLIPRVFTKRSRFGTPTNGIILGTFVIIALSVANFDALVEMLNFSYCLSMLLEFAAFIKLRIDYDDVERPYKIPFGIVGCILFVTPPCLLCVYLMFIASKMTYVYFGILSTFGAVFHLVQKAAKHHNWWLYEIAPKKARKSTVTINTTTSATAAAATTTATATNGTDASTALLSTTA